MMTEDSSSFWSAIAAIGSAVTAYFALRVQKLQHVEAARLELLLGGWERGEIVDPVYGNGYCPNRS
jgi:hypothetical protein